MNIAISTILILILILPGITLRKFYYSEEFSSQYTTKNLFELIISTFLPSIFLHFLMVGIVNLLGFHVNFEIVGQLLTHKGYPEEAFRNINVNKVNIFLYQIFTISLSGGIGYSLRKLIRQKLWDSKYKLLRFQNSWHYIITGEFFNFKRASLDLITDEVKSIDITYVDALVDYPEGSVIYEGFLVDYELYGKDDLKYITLKDVERRILPLNNEKANKTESYTMPGHIVVIPYEKILNLNFSYGKFTAGEEGVSIELVS
jgi:hypothetical protein